MTIVHKLPNYFHSWDPYCFSLHRRATPWYSFPEDYFSVTNLANTSFPSQVLYEHVMVKQGDFPGNTDCKGKQTSKCESVC